MPIRNADAIRSAILATLESRGSGIRTDAGEPIVDLVDAIAIEGERSNVLTEYLRRINSISGWTSIISDDGFKKQLADAFGIGFNTLSSDFVRSIGAPFDSTSDVEALLSVDLDAFAASFGRPRQPATQATATLRLILVSSGAYSLARGATVKRGSTSAVFYDTTETINISTPAVDPATGSFYVDVGIKCRTAGRIGNAIIGVINSTVGALTGVVSVANVTIADGGFERESNASLLSALDVILSGTNINTEQGLLNFIRAQAGVIDAILITPGNALMLRSTAGAVDVFIIGSKRQTNSAKAVVDFVGETFTLPFQPVLEISSVSDDLSNTFFFNGGFTVLPDLGNYSRSSKAHTQIQWALPPPDGVGPGAGRTMTVVYTFDGLVRDIQRRLDSDPKVDIPASAILIRLGTLVGATCSLEVVPIAGLNLLGLTQDDVNLAVETALQNYFEALKLGAPAEFSTALVAAAEAQIGGVNVVDHIDGFAMSKTGNILAFDDLSVAPNEYLRVDTVTFLT